MINIWEDKKWGPMLLSEVSKPFDSNEYLFEMKYDGIRAIVFVNKRELYIYTRNKKNITNLFPDLQSIKTLVKNNTIFDGEIIILEDNKPSFSNIQKRLHLKNKEKIKKEANENPVVFVCFDILYQNKDITNIPLSKRKIILEKYKENDSFIKTKYIENSGIKLFNAIKKLKLEGIVAKKKDSIYEINKRTSSWIKIKNLKEKNFFIGGYIEKNNNSTITLLLGEYKENKFYLIGKTILGKKTNLFKQIKNQPPINKSTFINYSDENATFINPNIKAKIKYQERTKNNQLRHPTIIF